MPIVSAKKPLRDKLGDDGIESLIDLLKESQAEQKEDMLVYLEEKYERRLGKEVGAISVTIAETEKRLDNRITEEIGKVNERLTQEIGKVNERLTEEVGKVNVTIAETEKRLDNRITEEIAGVKTDLANTRADLIKWMFIFWMGQVVALVGILFAFFK
jgi:DNA polymerase II large subunit